MGWRESECERQSNGQWTVDNGKLKVDNEFSKGRQVIAPRLLSVVETHGVGVIKRQHFRSTDDIIKAANDGLLPDQIMITTHPQRWTKIPIAWTKELVMQNVKNVVKGVLVKKLNLESIK